MNRTEGRKLRAPQCQGRVVADAQAKFDVHAEQSHGNDQHAQHGVPLSKQGRTWQAELRNKTQFHLDGPVDQLAGRARIDLQGLPQVIPQPHPFRANPVDRAHGLVLMGRRQDDVPIPSQDHRVLRPTQNPVLDDPVMETHDNPQRQAPKATGIVDVLHGI